MPFSSTASIPLLLTAAIAIAQTKNQPIPRFEDYPVKEIFTGTPAAPQIVTPEERTYRTRIRNGLFQGEGVTRDGGDGIEMAAIDAKTGIIYHLPVADFMPGKSFALPPLFHKIRSEPGIWSELGLAEVEFRGEPIAGPYSAECPWRK